MNLIALGVLVFAATRVTHLVTDDRFPFGYLRDWVNRGPLLKQVDKWSRLDVFRYWVHTGLECTFCVSIHAGFWSAVLADYAGWIPVDGWSDWPVFAVCWFAIAQLIVLLELINFRLLDEH